MARLRSAPAGTTDPDLSEGIRTAVPAQVGVIHALNTAIRNLDRTIAEKRDTRPGGNQHHTEQHLAA